MMADEELDAIKAIFSLPGEVRVESSSTSDAKQCTVVVKPYENVLHIFPNCSLTVVVTIPASYPAEPPTFSVFSDDLPRQDLSKLRTKAGQYLEDSAGMLPGILPLLMSLQDEFSMLMSERLGTVASLSSGNSGSRIMGGSVGGDIYGDVWILLVQINHMRAKVKYTKTLRNWSTELGLTGRLLFQGKLILNLLQGSRQQLKEFLMRQKMVNVDVDSRGRKCKERLLNILCEERLPGQAERYTDFRVVECEDASDLEQVFVQAHLDQIYLKHVKSVGIR